MTAPQSSDIRKLEPQNSSPLKSLGRKAVRTPAGGGIVIAAGTGIEPVIVGQKRAALTGGDGLVILEREAATVAEGADELALIRRAAGLGTVLDDAQIMLLRDGHDGIHIARDAAHMDTDDALGCRGDLLFNVSRIDRQRFVDLGDDRGLLWRRQWPRRRRRRYSRSRCTRRRGRCPQAVSADSSAPVQELVARQCFAPILALKCSSNLRTLDSTPSGP